MKDILLITPPFTQLNTPYPATMYLKGFLNTKGIGSFQVDLGIEVILELFSAGGLNDMFSSLKYDDMALSENAQRIYAQRNIYCKTIDATINFLQGRLPSLARKICSRNYLPEASRFEHLIDEEWAFGSMGTVDKAKHLATLYLEDLSDFIKECVDPHFGFSRYAEQLGRSANSFDELYEELCKELTFIDKITIKLLNQQLKRQPYKLVCFSVPFPGNLYSAFRCAKFIKEHYKEVAIAMGGGFANTELRSLSDARVFDFFDYISLDDGELPIELIYSNVIDPNKTNPNHQLFKRTFLKNGDEVEYNNFSLRKDYLQSELGTPDYSDLLLNRYIQVIEVANPMHSLWSDGRWNKLTMAHGCYWGKCTFCDVSLPYIKDYEPLTASLLVDRMEEMISQTGERGFHFVDEAAPPALMKALAMEIIKRQLDVVWWTNIRFEKSFTRDLCALLAASGCVAVSGGLEVASDRLLALIKKGVTVEQVAKVTHHLTQSGIMVHAYLMYGYPTQTIQETVDSLEMVRQLFDQGTIQSGFWHRFALTAHSPIGLNPQKFNILPIEQPISFANNDVMFEDETGIDHQIFSHGLKQSLYNYMHNNGFDMELQEWFDFEIPPTTIDPEFIYSCLAEVDSIVPKDNYRMIYTGSLPHLVGFVEGGESLTEMTFYSQKGEHKFIINAEFGEWLLRILKKSFLDNVDKLTFNDFKASFENQFDDFDAFIQSEVFSILQNAGLLFV